MASGEQTSVVKCIKLLHNIPDNERNLCLVVEVPSVNYINSYRCASNFELGLNVEHWKYLSDIHVVMSNVRQLYLFRSLTWKHYHCNKDTLLLAVKTASFPSKCRFTLPQRMFLIQNLSNWLTSILINTPRKFRVPLRSLVGCGVEFTARSTVNYPRNPETPKHLSLLLQLNASGIPYHRVGGGTAKTLWLECIGCITMLKQTMHSDWLLPPEQPIVRSWEMVCLMRWVTNPRHGTVEEVGRQTV
jgi:hypothetical protein